MTETYIAQLPDGRYEFGIIVPDDAGEQRVNRGVASSRREAEELLSGVNDLGDGE